MQNPYRICRHERIHIIVQVKISCDANALHVDANANVYACDVNVCSWNVWCKNPCRICKYEGSHMMVQLKISCFTNVFQEDAHASLMLVMQEFAPTCLMSTPYRICRCECSHMMVQMKTSCFANVFQEKNICKFICS